MKLVLSKKEHNKDSIVDHSFNDESDDTSSAQIKRITPRKRKSRQLNGSSHSNSDSQVNSSKYSKRSNQHTKIQALQYNAHDLRPKRSSSIRYNHQFNDSNFQRSSRNLRERRSNPPKYTVDPLPDSEQENMDKVRYSERVQLKLRPNSPGKRVELASDTDSIDKVDDSGIIEKNEDDERYEEIKANESSGENESKVMSENSMVKNTMANEYEDQYTEDENVRNTSNKFRHPSIKSKSRASHRDIQSKDESYRTRTRHISITKQNSNYSDINYDSDLMTNHYYQEPRRQRLVRKSLEKTTLDSQFDIPLTSEIGQQLNRRKISFDSEEDLLPTMTAKKTSSNKISNYSNETAEHDEEDSQEDGEYSNHESISEQDEYPEATRFNEDDVYHGRTTRSNKNQARQVSNLSNPKRSRRSNTQVNYVMQFAPSAKKSKEMDDAEDLRNSYTSKIRNSRSQPKEYRPYQARHESV